MPEGAMALDLPYNPGELAAALPDAREVEFLLVSQAPFNLEVVVHYGDSRAPVTVQLDAMPLDAAELLASLFKVAPMLRMIPMDAGKVDPDALAEAADAFDWGDNDDVG